MLLWGSGGADRMVLTLGPKGLSLKEDQTLDGEIGAHAADGSDAEAGKKRFRLLTRGAVKRLCVLYGLIAVLLVGVWATCIEMPGVSHAGALPALTPEQALAAQRLHADVDVLAGEHGRRRVFNPLVYAAAARYLEVRFQEGGLEPTREEFSIHREDGIEALCANVMAEIPGVLNPSRVVVIGAHYDSCQGTPGADDNASGVACMFELATRLNARRSVDSLFPACTVRFVCFANEEPPHFMTEEMGSRVHASGARGRGEDIALMISLEMLGYYDDAPGSQAYPPLLSAFYPDTGDFVAVVGNLGAVGHVRRLVGNWRAHAPFPCEGVALPSGIEGIGYSDHWSFWKADYPAVMVTDTSFFRNPHYHLMSDRPGTLDYERMARVVDALETVIAMEAD